MKKKLLFMFALLLGAAASAWADVEINETNFPNEAFRTYVTQFDTDQNGSFSEEELAAATQITPTSLGITNLKGVEHFKYCTFLNITGNQIKDVDVSALENMEILTCNGIGLETIMFHPNLQRLYASDNNLTELNIPENSQLTDLQAQNNRLQKLIFPELNQDIIVSVQYNELTELDVTQLANLTYLACNSNHLTSIDLTGKNRLGLLYVSMNPITSLDLTDCVAIQELGLVEVPVTEIDLSTMTQLWRAGISRTQLTEINLSNHQNLEFAEMRENEQLEKIDISGCSKMTTLHTFDNPKLEELNIDGCIYLQLLDCSNNALTKLNCYDSPWLNRFNCSNNQLTELHMPQDFYYAPFEFFFFNNQLKGEAMDEVMFKIMKYMSTQWPNFLVALSDSPDEGNVLDYTLTTGYNSIAPEPSMFQLLKYTGEGTVNITTNWGDAYAYSEPITAGTASVVLDENGYGTFTSIIPFDLGNIYGPKVYKVESAEGNKVQMEEITDAISVEAGTGILLVGEPGEEVFIPCAPWNWGLMNEYWADYGYPGFWDRIELEGNMHVGNLTKRTFAAGEAYILKDGKFVLTQGDREELPCHTAYLPADAVINGADVLNLVGDGITGVEEITAPINDENAPIFDVMGRRVLNPQAGGIYIQNGKKFIQR